MPFISPDELQWAQIVQANPHDMYQLPGYSRLEATALEGNPIAWVYQEKETEPVVIPLIERVIHNNGVVYKDLVSPYGYPGLVYSTSTTHAQFCTCLKSFHEEAANCNYVSSFVRLHPLYNTFQINKQSGISQHAHGPTVSINLNLPLAEIRQSYSSNHRRNMRRLCNEGFKVSVNQWSLLPDFIKLYWQTMSRKMAKKRYFFDVAYFEGLKALLGDNLMLVMVHNNQSTPAAGGLFSIVEGLAQFHLGGTAEDFVGQSPSKLMMDAAVSACKDQGAHTLHLGGGYGSSASDGLFRFKAGFGQQRHSFSTLRFIHRRDTYRQLMENTNLPSKNPGTYFPEYRFLGT